MNKIYKKNKKVKNENNSFIFPKNKKIKTNKKKKVIYSYKKKKKSFRYRATKKLVKQIKNFGLKFFRKKFFILKLSKSKGLNTRLHVLYKNKYAALRKIYKYLKKKRVKKAINVKTKFLKRINIKFVQNNIFCTLVDLKKKRTLHTSSSGKYKVKISKRKLKHFFIRYLIFFFKKIKKNVRNLNYTLFKIIAPIKIRKKVCKLIKTHFRKIKIRGRKKVNFKKQSSGKQKKKTRKPSRKKRNILILIDPKKCFNGCRAKKKIRKKRRLYRIFKKS